MKIGLEVYEDLSQKVIYNSETGIFIWKHRDEDTHGNNIFNAKFEGKECGRITESGYRTIKLLFNNKQYMVAAHRLAWFITYGVLPDDEIDHINHVKTDNRICNLRDVTRATNLRNSPMQRNNKSGITGVSWDSLSKKWMASVKVDRKSYYLGIFKDIKDAEEVVKSFRAKHGFTDTHGERKQN